MNRRQFLQLCASAPMLALSGEALARRDFDEYNATLEHPHQYAVYHFQLFGQCRINFTTNRHLFYCHGLRTAASQGVEIQEISKYSEHARAFIAYNAASFDASVLEVDDALFCPFYGGVITSTDSLSFLVNPVSNDRLYLMLAGQWIDQPLALCPGLDIPFALK